MAKPGRPKQTTAEKERKTNERLEIGSQLQAAIEKYLSQHEGETRTHVSRLFGISPQHLDRITTGGIKPPDEVLSRAAHFFDMNIVFRGQAFKPSSFNPPSSPAEVYAEQLSLKLEQPILLSGGEVKMRVVEKAEDRWNLEIWVVKMGGS